MPQTQMIANNLALNPNAVQMTPQTNAVTKEEFDAFKTEILEAIKNNNKNHYNNKKG